MKANNKFILFLLTLGILYLPLTFLTKLGSTTTGFLLGLSGAIIHIFLSILVYKKPIITKIGEDS